MTATNFIYYLFIVFSKRQIQYLLTDSNDSFHRWQIIVYHVVDVVVRSDFLVKRLVQPADDQVAVVFVFHQLADAVDFEPADAFSFQDLVHNLLTRIINIFQFNNLLLN